MTICMVIYMLKIPYLHYMYMYKCCKTSGAALFLFRQCLQLSLTSSNILGFYSCKLLKKPQSTVNTNVLCHEGQSALKY